MNLVWNTSSTFCTLAYGEYITYKGRNVYTAASSVVNGDGLLGKALPVRPSLSDVANNKSVLVWKTKEEAQRKAHYLTVRFNGII